jgi:hypothetical protein
MKTTLGFLNPSKISPLLAISWVGFVVAIGQTGFAASSPSVAIFIVPTFGQFPESYSNSGLGLSLFLLFRCIL